MRFVKMHGAGNDFILLDAAEETFSDEQFALMAECACDRHRGIGADGLILVLPSKIANFRMKIINADGSEAEMCGNGIRCFAKYLFDRKVHTDVVMTVETPAGVKTLKLDTAGGKVNAVRVDMGEPKLRRSEIPMKGVDQAQVVSEPLKVGGKKLEVTCVSMGNPHCVVFVDRTEDYPVDKVGPLIENHHCFPQRTNVEFAQVINEQEIAMRVWERGVGETMACGTGACAAAIASMLNGKVDRKVSVHLLGGDLFVEWLGDNRVFMTGPAEEVFEGKVSPSVVRKWTSAG